MTYDEFVEIAREETALLPSYVFEELDGGVVADPNVYLHPGRLSDDLYIMGTYSQGIYGSQIVLYYGSFQATMPFASTAFRFLNNNPSILTKEEFEAKVKSVPPPPSPSITTLPSALITNGLLAVPFLEKVI